MHGVWSVCNSTFENTRIILKCPELFADIKKFSLTEKLQKHFDVGTIPSVEDLVAFAEQNFQINIHTTDPKKKATKKLYEFSENAVELFFPGLDFYKNLFRINTMHR